VVFSMAPTHFMGVSDADQWAIDHVLAAGKPFFRVHTGGSTGGSAVQAAVALIRARMFRSVFLVVGAERLGECPDAQAILNLTFDAFYERDMPLSTNTIVGLMATRYLHHYSLTERDLATVVARQRRNALKNPYAHLKGDITVDDVLQSPLIACPLKLCGSDLKAVRTTARRDGNTYVLNGAKTFISNGAMADLIIVASMTNPAAGAKGISLIAVETGAVSGFKVGRILDKIGMRGQDTAELFFDDVWVPAENLLGEEGSGFGYLMKQLIHERLMIAVFSAASTEAAVDETVEYTKQRTIFGAPLFDMQNTRFELAECKTLAEVSRTFFDRCIERHLAGDLDPASASMAKAFSTDVEGKVIDRCLQLFGGYGYMMEYSIARRYANARISRIYAGANEVMNELIARSL
jgi:Acyl-CoA dehydrogenase, C-terminal domain/Acyl-CoA dehydrogenase, middle domain/Thiolase, N-terminal domain